MCVCQRSESAHQMLLQQTLNSLFPYYTYDRESCRLVSEIRTGFNRQLQASILIYEKNQMRGQVTKINPTCYKTTARQPSVPPGKVSSMASRSLNSLNQNITNWLEGPLTHLTLCSLTICCAQAIQICYPNWIFH